MSEELTPGMNDFLVFHPLELNEGQTFSVDPVDNNDGEFVFEVDKLIFSLVGCFLGERSNVIEFVCGQVIDKENFVLNSLSVLIFKVGRDSDSEFLL